MKLLTKETDYAIRAIMKIAGHEGRFVSSRTISVEDRIPLQFLRRILRTLIQQDIIESKEGIAGGVRLRVEPSTIRLTDIIQMFQGDIQLSECMFRRRICANRDTCALRKRIGKIEQMVTREFEQITIGDLLKDMEGGV